jgi:hypothetical protein
VEEPLPAISKLPSETAYDKVEEAPCAKLLPSKTA